VISVAYGRMAGIASTVPALSRLWFGPCPTTASGKRRIRGRTATHTRPPGHVQAGPLSVAWPVVWDRQRASVTSMAGSDNDGDDDGRVDVRIHRRRQPIEGHEP
jgi:uncharacterized protein involved in type VI secretion and phage assembly